MTLLWVCGHNLFSTVGVRQSDEVGHCSGESYEVAVAGVAYTQFRVLGLKWGSVLCDKRMIEREH